MSNSFNGRIFEFPGIQVDYFGPVPDFPAPSACFLSHIHADHIQGLDEKFTGPFIYCSHATKNTLLGLRSRADPEKCKFARLNPKFLRPLDMDFAHSLSLNSITLQVTLIDANHCPGSVMFLFQDTSGTAVLYTGDMRAEPWFVNSLSQHPSLIPFMAGSTLSCIYADTTFAYRAKPYIEMPTNADGIKRLLAYLELYEKSTKLFFTTLTSGYEKALLWTAAKFHEKIHMDEIGYRQIELASKNDVTCRSLLAFLTLDADATRIHACSKKSACPHRTRRDVVFLSPVVNKSRYEVEEWNSALNVSDYEAIKASALAPLDGQQETDQQASVFIYEERRYIRGKSRNTLLPARLLFHFSRHSSYDELTKFVELFNPKSVYPCVTTPENEADPEFLMRTLFGHLCCLDQRFIYDEMILKKFPDRYRRTPADHMIMGIGKKKTWAKPMQEDESASKSPGNSDTQSNSQILQFLNNAGKSNEKETLTLEKSASKEAADNGSSASETTNADLLTSKTIGAGSPPSAQPKDNISQTSAIKISHSSFKETSSSTSPRKTPSRDRKSRPKPGLMRKTDSPTKNYSRNLRHMSSILSKVRIYDLARMLSCDNDVWYDLQLDFRSQTRII